MTQEPHSALPEPLPYPLRFKPVMRWDRRERVYRLFRIMWVHGRVGDGNGGYSAKLSAALTPRVVGFRRGSMHRPDWTVIVLGLRFHYQRAYGAFMFKARARGAST